MARRLTLLLVALFALALLAEDVAHGFPWRRRRVYYSSGPVQVAMKNPAALTDYPEVGAVYNYNRARGEEVAFKDRIRFFVEIYDEDLLASNDELVAEVRLTDLRNSEHERTVFVPVTLESIEESDSRLGVFEVANAQRPTQQDAVQKGPAQKGDPEVSELAVAGDDSTPVQDSGPASGNQGATQKAPVQKVVAPAPLVSPESVYRAFVILHRRAPQYGTKTAWGRLRGPYYVATSGDSQLAKARHHIVMRTFKEFYYTERGWVRDENSPLDCHAYYCWATGSCTKGASYGYTDPGWLFDRYHGGYEVADLATEGSIHGDYVRIPGHTFMMLAYDTHLNQVWTMESNFNYTVEVAIRPPDGSWTVGHLLDNHIREDLFQPSSDDALVGDESDEMSSAGLTNVSMDIEDVPAAETR